MALTLDPGLSPGVLPQQPANFLVGVWEAGLIDPRSWELGKRPSHEHVVREGCSGQLQLQRRQY